MKRFVSSLLLCLLGASYHHHAAATTAGSGNSGSSSNIRGVTTAVATTTAEKDVAAAAAAVEEEEVQQLEVSFLDVDTYTSGNYLDHLARRLQISGYPGCDSEFNGVKWCVAALFDFNGNCIRACTAGKIDDNSGCDGLGEHYCSLPRDCCRGRCNSQATRLLDCIGRVQNCGDKSTYACLATPNPTPRPTVAPTSGTPTTTNPTVPPGAPSASPVTSAPSEQPTSRPTDTPSMAPSVTPTRAPRPAALACFSGDMTVQVLQNQEGYSRRQVVALQDLKVGDLVLTRSSTKDNAYEYQPVYAFGHRSTTTLARFYQITTTTTTGTAADASSPLEMTGDHLVFQHGKANPVRADSLKVGDVLTMYNSRTVTSIDLVEKVGLYAPLTPGGSVVVQGIVASSYVAIQAADREHIVLNNKYALVSHGTFAHLYMSPFRMLCMGVSSSLCQIYNSEGIPYPVSGVLQVMQWAIGDGKVNDDDDDDDDEATVTNLSNLMVQFIFFAITIPLVFACWVLESIFGASLVPLIFFTSLVVARKMYRAKAKLL